MCGLQGRGYNHPILLVLGLHDFCTPFSPRFCPLSVRGDAGLDNGLLQLE